MTSQTKASVHVWIATILFVFGFSHVVWADDCRLKQVATFDFTVNDSGKIIIPILINEKPYRFSVSTGDAFSKINQKIVEAQNLTPRPMPGGISVTGKDEKIETQIFASVQLGPMKGSGIAFLPIKSLEEDGIIGLDILSSHDMEIDFEKRRLNLFLQDHCPGNGVYWARNFAALKYKTELTGEMHSTMSLEGKPVDVVLNLATEKSSMSSDTAERLFGIRIGTTPLNRLPDQDGRSVFQYPFRTLAADGITVENPNIIIFQSLDTDLCKESPVVQPAAKRWFNPAGHCLGGRDLTLGQSVLQHLHLFFAFKEHVIYFTAADAHG